MSKLPRLPESYAPLLAELKQRIANARLQAALATNRELICSIGRLGGTSWPGSAQKDGGQKSSTDWRQICTGPFRGWPACRFGISSTCGLLPRRGPTSNSCNRLLHYCRGATTRAFSTHSRHLPSASGTPARQSITAGAAMSSRAIICSAARTSSSVLGHHHAHRLDLVVRGIRGVAPTAEGVEQHLALQRLAQALGEVVGEGAWLGCGRHAQVLQVANTRCKG